MYLKNKNVVITGADGFIGSHLVEQLVLNGAKVRAFVYYNSFNTWGWLESLDDEIINKIDIFSGDIRDSNGVKECLKDQEIVFHLAALIGIPFSYHSPNSYIDTNVKGTLNIIQAAKELNLERVMLTSTSEVYGSAQFTPITEDHPKQPQSPYSATKISADAIAESFYRTFGCPITIVRPFNTYGPRQSARAIIPTIITQLLDGNIEIKLGDLSSTRDFVYVRDTVKGFIKIASTDKTIGEDINIATQKEITIGDLADYLIEAINPKAKIQIDAKRIRPEKSEVNRLLGSTEKLFKLTGWKPSIPLGKGLKETIEWFSIKSNRMNYKSSIYNI